MRRLTIAPGATPTNAVRTAPAATAPSVCVRPLARSKGPSFHRTAAHEPAAANSTIGVSHCRWRADVLHADVLLACFIFACCLLTCCSLHLLLAAYLLHRPLAPSLTAGFLLPDCSLFLRPAVGAGANVQHSARAARRVGCLRCREPAACKEDSIHRLLDSLPHRSKPLRPCTSACHGCTCRIFSSVFDGPAIHDAQKPVEI